MIMIDLEKLVFIWLKKEQLDEPRLTLTEYSSSLQHKSNMRDILVKLEDLDIVQYKKPALA